MAAGERAERGLGALQAILSSALGVVEDIIGDPLVERLLRAFAMLPAADRDAIVTVLERDAHWCRISEEAYPLAGIRARVNRYGSLYVHVVDQVTGQPIEPEPSARDISVIRSGAERLARMIPLLAFEPVREQWRTSVRELIRASDPELRTTAERLGREVLALLAEEAAEMGNGAATATTNGPRGGSPT
jgi:hypothetical protein